MSAENSFSDLPWAETSLIRLTGSDAESFLQGQLTRSITDLSESEQRPAAWCNAQGRVLTTLGVAKFSEGYWLRLPKALCAEITKRLQMFVMRADVKVENYASEYSGYFVTANNAEKSANTNTDQATKLIWPSIHSEGVVTHFESWSKAPACGQESTLAHQRFERCQAEVFQSSAGMFVPHALELQNNHYIDFNKGCYPGQEVIAKSEHRGRVKRQLKRFKLEAIQQKEVPIPGTEVSCSNGPAAAVVEAHRWNDEILVLAVVHESSDIESLQVNSAPLIPIERSLNDV